MSHVKYRPFHTAGRDVNFASARNTEFTGGWSRVTSQTKPNSWRDLAGGTAYNNTTLGSRLERNSVFGGESEARSVFGGRSQSRGAFGGESESRSVFGGRSQSRGAFGGESEARSIFGGRSQSRGAFGGESEAHSIFGGRSQSRGVFGGGRNEGYCTCPCESEKRGGCSKDQRTKAALVSNDWFDHKKDITGKKKERDDEIGKAWEKFKKEKKIESIGLTHKEFENGIAQIIYCNNRKDNDHELQEKDVIVTKHHKEKRPDYGVDRAKLANTVKKYLY